MKDKLYVFYHIPKTGGVTFMRLIDKNFPGESFDINNCFRGKLQSVKFIYGHFDISYLEKHKYFEDREIIKFTFLREPISRSLSYYNHFNKTNKVDFVKFFSDTRNSSKGNTMTKYFSNNSQKTTEPTEEDYEIALKNLKNVNIGFTEEYDESLKQFSDKYPEVFKTIEYTIENKSILKYHPSEEDIELLKSVNYFDIRLYNDVRDVAE